MQGILKSESSVVWGEVSEAILEKSWEKAREAKSCIEGRQREIGRERKAREEEWSPKYFTVSHTKENEWDCFPNYKFVPPAPILVNHS